MTALQAAIDQFSDYRWRLNNLYWITSKDGQRVQFKTNTAQEQLLDNLHYCNVILKARQLGFCLDPETRVLTADLRWVPIKDIPVGSEVVACDENVPGGRGAARKMRTAKVLASARIIDNAYRITFDDGRSVVCSGGHRWLSRKAQKHWDWRSIESKNKKKLRVGSKIRWVTQTWGAATAEDGWFGGMLDGEGSISKANTSAGVSVSQREGPVWDRLHAYAENQGYSARIEDDKDRPSKFGSDPVPKLALGRMDELFRLLGQTRPTRFVNSRFWEGRDMPGKKTGVGFSTITDIERLGSKTLVDLQTDTGTFVAEGFVSHNSTLIQLIMLDACVFNSNMRAGTIAHTREDAEAIFRDKAKYPYDNLPEQIRSSNPATMDAARHLSFANNSSIRVGTSLRSGTFQYLHISEYGKICAKYPEKAREVRTGALNTVQAGQMIFVESTAEGQEGDFYRMCQEAEVHQSRGDRLTPLDFKLHFFPWWLEPGYRLAENVLITQELEDYFDDLQAKGISLDNGQRAWYAAKQARQDEDMFAEYPSEPDEAFRATVEGAYYGKAIRKLEEEGKISEVPHDASLGVETWWDLGINDLMSIWFVQRKGVEYRIIDFYQNSGEGLGHYAHVLQDKQQEREFTYSRHVWPHDGNARILDEKGRKRTDVMRDLGYEVDVAERGLIQTGIQAVRDLLPFCYFDAKHCEHGIKNLRLYRKEWDDNVGTWKKTPLHDHNSHAADAFRTGASYSPPKGRRKGQRMAPELAIV